MWVIRGKTFQKTSDSLENSYFSYVFDSFLLYYAKSKLLTSLFSHLLFLKSDLSELLLSLITKERPWSMHSRCSLKKSKSGICSKKRVNHTFALSLKKKRAICSKNWWANSKPWWFTHKQGWEFEHQFFKQIASFLWSKEWNTDSLRSGSCLKIDGFDLLTVALFKKLALANRSRWSLKKSEEKWEQRATEVIHSIGMKRGKNCQKHEKRANHSFFECESLESQANHWSCSFVMNDKAGFFL